MMTPILACGEPQAPPKSPAPPTPPQVWKTTSPNGESWRISLHEEKNTLEWNVALGLKGEWSITQRPGTLQMLDKVSREPIVLRDMKGGGVSLQMGEKTTPCRDPKIAPCLHEAWLAGPQALRDHLMDLVFTDFGSAGGPGFEKVVNRLITVFLLEGPPQPPPDLTWQRE